VLVLQREQALNTLRNLAGPADPEKARNEQPDTLRARYGVDSSLNALYIRSTMATNVVQTTCWHMAQHADSLSNTAHSAARSTRSASSRPLAVPCRAVPCRAVPCRAVPCRAVPCPRYSCSFTRDRFGRCGLARANRDSRFRPTVPTAAASISHAHRDACVVCFASLTAALRVLTGLSGGCGAVLHCAVSRWRKRVETLRCSSPSLT
jgi:hypothetical protein